VNKTVLNNRFSFHPANTVERADQHESVRYECRSLAHFLNDLLPDSPEKSNAIDRLDEVQMWANAAIARYSE
jgi:hypothetical protein